MLQYVFDGSFFFFELFFKKKIVVNKISIQTLIIQFAGLDGSGFGRFNCVDQFLIGNVNNEICSKNSYRASILGKPSQILLRGLFALILGNSPLVRFVEV